MVRQEIGIRKKKDKKTEDEDMGFGGWGGYMAAKRSKLIDQFHDANIEKVSDIFKDVAIHVNGLTKPPIDVLKNLMAAHGGLFHAYQVSSTTHIIASNLANVKIKKLGSTPIVKPAWITDSIGLGKLLDYRRYLLYSNQSVSQPSLQFPVTRPNERDTLKTDETFSESKGNSHEHASTDTMDVYDTDQEIISNQLHENNSHLSLGNTSSAQNQAHNNEDSCQKADDSENKEKEGHFNTKKADYTKQLEPSHGQINNRSRASTKTAADPTFLKEFYNNSRLHLISTLGAEYKQLVNDLREKSNGTFPGRSKLQSKGKLTASNREGCIIMHIDMDCFFVSVGLRNHPELKGKPVAVAHARSGEIKNVTVAQKMNREQEFALYSDRLPVGVTSRVDKIDTLSSLSEIASCSYEARSFGIRNGMFLGQAIKMCPELKMLPYDFEGYKEVSRTLYKIIASYTLDIEAVSCDEMYVDLTSLLKDTGLSVEEWADHIRNEITSSTGCPCSTGFGSNRLQARMATRRAKPAGKFYLKNEDAESYMTQIPLSDLPGVGRATLSKLRALGLNSCGDIQAMPLKALQNEIGQKLGETIKEQAMGIDKKPLNFLHERKSVSAEVNYGIRFKTLAECHTFLENLSVEVYDRLKSIHMKAKCVTLKLLIRAADAPLETAKFLGHGICDSISRSKMNVVLTDSKTIYSEILSLYNKLNPPFTDLRGIGIQLSKLEKIAPVNSAMINFLKRPAAVRPKEEKLKTENIVRVQNQKSVPDVFSFSHLGEVTSTGRVKNTAFTNKKVDFARNNFAANKDNDFKNQIDMDVLKELPEELRQEVIKEYNLNETPQIPKADTNTKNVAVDEDEDITSPFSELKWDDLKLIIQRWITSAEEPEEVDTLMIGKHFKSYAINRKIELLFTIFNTLHRMFSNLTCNWHSVYFTIVNMTQEGMVARYGNTLMVKRSFSCCQM